MSDYYATMVTFSSHSSLGTRSVRDLGGILMKVLMSAKEGVPTIHCLCT